MAIAQDGTHRNLAIPADGKLSVAAESPDWQQITSPDGLTLFMKRDASATQTHHLGIQLLKKREWHPLDAVRIAAIDIIPVNQVADNAAIGRTWWNTALKIEKAKDPCPEANKDRNPADDFQPHGLSPADFPMFRHCG